MKEDLLKIIEHYGVLPQLKYFQSEVFELNEAILGYEHPNDITRPFIELKANINNETSPYIAHIEEEIADVMVMLEQFIEYYDLDKENIIKIMKEKIKRQLERIEEEKK